MKILSKRHPAKPRLKHILIPVVAGNFPPIYIPLQIYGGETISESITFNTRYGPLEVPEEFKFKTQSLEKV